MKVLQYLEPRRVQIADIPKPTIDADQVLVRLHACGVCGTDVKTFVRGHPHIRPGSVLGHEMTGVIEESRSEGWCAGERVVVAPYVPCGDCVYCARGQFTLCQHLFDVYADPGGFSEYLHVPNRIVQKGMFRLPEHLDFAAGTLVEPIACSFHGLDALALVRGESFLVIGDGPMGLIQAMLAHSIGASPIVVAGMTPPRLAIAARFADKVINVADANLQDAVKAMTNGAGMDKVIVSVGQAQVAENALALVRRGGVVNFFAGLPSNSRISIDPNRLHYDEISIVGTSGFAPSHFKRGLEALASGAVDASVLITRTVPLEGLEKAFGEIARYEGIKTVAMLA